MLPQTSCRNVGWISQSHRSQQTSLSVMGLSLPAFWAASGSKDKPDLAQSQWKDSSKHWHVWMAVPEPWRSPWTNGRSAPRTAHSTREFLNKPHPTGPSSQPTRTAWLNLELMALKPTINTQLSYPPSKIFFLFLALKKFIKLVLREPEGSHSSQDLKSLDKLPACGYFNPNIKLFSLCRLF